MRLDGSNPLRWQAIGVTGVMAKASVYPKRKSRKPGVGTLLAVGLLLAAATLIGVVASTGDDEAPLHQTSLPLARI